MLRILIWRFELQKLQLKVMNLLFDRCRNCGGVQKVIEKRENGRVVKPLYCPNCNVYQKEKTCANG